MDDHHDDGRDRREAPGRGPDRQRQGPPGTEFLELEMSKVIAGEADGLAVDCARELLREAIRDRLRERLGDRIAAVGRLAADRLANDVEASLRVESTIAERVSARGSFEAEVRAALAEEPKKTPRAARPARKAAHRTRRR